MKKDELNKLLSDARQAWREPAGDGGEMPPGFVSRVLRNAEDSGSSGVVLFHRMSFAGVGVAAAIALTVAIVSHRPLEDDNGVSMWMELSEGGMR